MNYLNDDPLEDLFGGATTGTPRAPARPEIAAIVEATFTEPCRKCGGTGRYRHLGQCFACKGKGRFEFKQSPEKRAANREKRVVRAAAKEETRWNEFVAEHAAEAAWILANTSFDFAVKMKEAIEKFGGLTENQLAAIRRCILRQEQRAIERDQRKANAPVVDASKIYQAFTIAHDKAARPNMKGVWTRPMPLTSSDATGKQTVVFQIGRPGGKWADTVFVRTQDDRKLGMIRDGKFARRFECTDAQEAAILECASDPAVAAKAYGKAWNTCCVCARTLTNDESIERGIGPICAERFGW